MTTPGPRTTVDIREANTAAVGRLLREYGELSRSELVRLSGLARPTVGAALDRLVRDGLVAEARRVHSGTGGRPTTLLRFRTEARVIAAARFRDRSLEATLTDLGGAPIAARTAPRPAASCTPVEVASAFAELITTLVAENPDAGPLAAACLSLPGAVDRSRGRWSSPTNARWTDVPVGDVVAARIGVPVTVINVVASALVGQLCRDDEDSDAGAALVYLGRGLGSAIAVGGRLVDGAHGSAGELGHVTVPGSTVPCRCGRVGCVEASCAMAFLRREYHAITGRQAPATVAAMERSDDPAVRALLDGAAERFGWAASVVANVLDPTVVYLGGGPVTEGADRFLDRAATVLLANTHRAVREGLRVVPARRGAVLVGTAHVAGESLPTWLRPRLRIAG